MEISVNVIKLEPITLNHSKNLVTEDCVIHKSIPVPIDNLFNLFHPLPWNSTLNSGPIREKPGVGISSSGEVGRIS
jgi:hypothetical protein